MEKKLEKITAIIGIGNYNRGLWVLEYEGNYYWIIENFSTDFESIDEWGKIDKSLYDKLIEHNNKLKGV